MLSEKPLAQVATVVKNWSFKYATAIGICGGTVTTVVGVIAIIGDTGMASGCFATTIIITITTAITEAS